MAIIRKTEHKYEHQKILSSVVQTFAGSMIRRGRKLELFFALKFIKSFERILKNLSTLWPVLADVSMKIISFSLANLFAAK